MPPLDCHIPISAIHISGLLPSPEEGDNSQLARSFAGSRFEMADIMMHMAWIRPVCNEQRGLMIGRGRPRYVLGGSTHSLSLHRRETGVFSAELVFAEARSVMSGEGAQEGEVHFGLYVYVHRGLSDFPDSPRPIPWRYRGGVLCESPDSLRF